MTDIQALEAARALGIIGRVSISELAQRRGESIATVYRRIDRQEIPRPQKFGGRVSYSPLVAIRMLLDEAA